MRPSERAGPRSRLPLAVGTAGVGVLVIAVLAFTGLQRLADRSRSAELALFRAHAGAHRLDALEWEMIASGAPTPALRAELAARRGELEAAVAQLAPRGQDAATVAAIRAACREYLAALDREVALIEAGRWSETAALDAAVVDPAFDRLSHALGQASERCALAASRDGAIASGGMLLTLLLAIAIIGALTGVASRLTRRAAVAGVERRVWRESGQRYRELFEANPHPMWVVETHSGRFLAVNDAAIDLYGWSREEFLGMSLADVRAREAADSHDPAQDPPDAGFQGATQCRHVRRDGTLLEIEARAGRLQFDGRAAVAMLIHDVTRRARLESQVREAQKLEAVGQLAGGIAHEFNNLLTAIAGYAQMLRGALAQGRDRRSLEHAQEILRATDRAAALVRQLLAFGRRQVTRPEELDLHDVLLGQQAALRGVVGEDVRLVVRPARGLGRVLADPGEIEQVIVNLILNARDAMPRGGEIVLETGEVELDEAAAGEIRDGRPGRWVMLAVRDNGTGMDAKTLARLFEPFFSTRGPDRGTGLGLPAVHGIVRGLGGFIGVTSAPGRGSTFRIYLPRLEARSPMAGAPAEAWRGPAGSEVVLVAEDDAAVRALVCEILDRLGYRVLAAANGREALDLARSCPDDLQLLVTDVVMPEMGGRVLAERLAESRPGLRVMFMSGYTDDALLRHGIEQHGVVLLQKPFTAEQLAARVREVLDAPRPAA